MTNWKSLINNPPTEDCNICVKVGDNYETYRFIKLSTNGWVLMKYPREIMPDQIPNNALYINLSEIK